MACIGRSFPSYINVHNVGYLSQYKHKDGESKSKSKCHSLKVLWYLLVVSQLKQLFTNANDAKLMRWHEDGHTKDGHLRHPIDGL